MDRGFSGQFAMPSKVVAMAEPSDIERVGVIVVVRLGGQCSTESAWFWEEFTPAYEVGC